MFENFKEFFNKRKILIELSRCATACQRLLPAILLSKNKEAVEASLKSIYSLS